GYSPGLSFREIARYPVSFPLYCFLNSIYGLLDPAALTSLLWLLAMWAGILLEKPAWALLAAVLFLVFIVFNVLCNRIIIGLLDRFQSTRRGREIMVVVFLVLMLAPQMFQFVGRDLGRIARSAPLRPLLGAVLPINRISPPGVVFETLSLDASQKLLPGAMLLIYTAIALLLLLRQSRAVYQGEIYSEGYAARKELKVKPGWSVPGIDLTVVAIFEKEIRYLKQNLRLLLLLIYPVIFLAFLFSGNGPFRHLSFGRTAAGLLGSFAGILALSVPNMSYNIFGVENEGFGRWLLSPVPLQKIIFAKNLAHGVIFSALYFLAAVVISLIFHVDVLPLLTITLAFFTVLIVQFAVGNYSSAHWPKKVDLTKMNSRMASNAAGYASLLVNVCVLSIGAMVVMVSRSMELSWLPFISSVAGLGVALLIYSTFLHSTVDYLYGHLEEIERILSS